MMELDPGFPGMGVVGVLVGLGLLGPWAVPLVALGALFGFAL